MALNGALYAFHTKTTNNKMQSNGIFQFIAVPTKLHAYLINTIQALHDANIQINRQIIYQSSQHNNSVY